MSGVSNEVLYFVFFETENREIKNLESIFPWEMEPVQPDVICFAFYILDQQNTNLLKSSCRILHWKHKSETLLSVKPLRFRKA